MSKSIIYSVTTENNDWNIKYDNRILVKTNHETKNGSPVGGSYYSISDARKLARLLLEQADEAEAFDISRRNKKSESKPTCRLLKLIKGWV